MPWQRARVHLLLAASFFFYASWNHWLAAIIAVSSTLDYGVARAMNGATDTRRRKLLLSDYLAAITQDCGVPVLDATEWSAKQDFWDGHHLLADGATRFTQRFCHEFLDTFAASLSNAPRLSQRPMDQRQ